MSSNTFVYTASYDLTVRLSQIFKEQVIGKPQSFSVSTSQVNRIMCTDDRKIIIAINPYILIYDAPNRGKLIQLTGHSTNVNDVICVNGNYFSCSEDRTWQFWDPRQRTRSLKCCNTSSALNSIQIDSSQNYLITSNEKGQIEAWDLRTSTLLCSKKLSEQPIRSSAVSKNNIIVSGCQDKYVRINSFNGTEFEEITSFQAHDDIILRTLISPDEKYFITTSADSSSKLWSMEDYTLKYHLTDEKQTEWVWDASFTKDSKYVVTGGTDKTYRTWEIETGKMIYSNSDAHTKGITALCTFEQI